MSKAKEVNCKCSYIVLHSTAIQTRPFKMAHSIASSGMIQAWNRLHRARLFASESSAWYLNTYSIQIANVPVPLSRPLKTRTNPKQHSLVLKREGNAPL